MLTALALLVLSQSVLHLDAGTPPNATADSQSSGAGAKPFSAAIYAECPDAADAGLAYHDDARAAWVLPDPRGPRQACLLAACEEDRRYRSSPEATVPTWAIVVMTVAEVVVKAGIAVGGWAITKAASAPPP